MPEIDIRPAAAQMAGVVALVPDDVLDAPTPCEGLTVGSLIGHGSASRRCSPCPLARGSGR